MTHWANSPNAAAARVWTWLKGAFAVTLVVASFVSVLSQLVRAL